MSWIITAGLLSLAITEAKEASDLVAVESRIWVSDDLAARVVDLVEPGEGPFFSGQTRYYQDGRVERWLRRYEEQSGITQWVKHVRNPGQHTSRVTWSVLPYGAPADGGNLPRLVAWTDEQQEGEVVLRCQVSSSEEGVQRLRFDGHGRLISMTTGAVTHRLDYEGAQLIRIVSEDSLATHRWVFMYEGGKLRRLDGMARRFELAYDQAGRLKAFNERWFDDSGWRTETHLIYRGQGPVTAGYPRFDFGFLFDLNGRRVNRRRMIDQVRVETLLSGYCSIFEAMSR